jgi:hypothetical protein
MLTIISRRGMYTGIIFATNILLIIFYLSIPTDSTVVLHFTETITIPISSWISWGIWITLVIGLIYFGNIIWLVYKFMI